MGKRIVYKSGIRMKDEFDELLTIGEAAEVVGVHPSTIRRRIEKGKLIAFRVGPRLIRVRRSDLERLFKSIETESG